MDSFTTQDENTLIGLIYDAALAPERWHQVLTAIKDAMGVDDYTIYFYDAQCRSRNYANSATDDRAVIEQYLRDYIDAEVAVINENFKHIPAGLVVSSHQLRVENDSYEQLFEEGYSEMVSHMLVRAGIPIIQGSIIASAMGIKTFAHKPPPTKASLAFLQRLSPHIQQAMHIHNQVTSLQASYTNIRAALEATRMGVFLLSESQQVLFANSEAMRIIASGSGLNIAAGGRLQHMHLSEHVKLQHAIELQLREGIQMNSLTRILALTHTHKTLPLKISLLPIHHDHAQRFAETGASLAIFVKDPNRSLDVPAQYLRQAYDFTETEVNIAQALLAEIQLEKISQKRNTSLETTRWHIKKMTQKTNTHSQAELMQLLACLSSEL